MSLLAKQDSGRGASGTSVPGAARPFSETLSLRLQSLKEAVDSGEVPEGTVWLVRVIEAGRSLNGFNYTEDALKAAVPVFEGVAVRNYAWSEDPAAKDADHLPDAIAELDDRGLVGNEVGSLEGVFYNEEAKALDAYFKVYDTKFRERMLTAYKLGDIGEGGKRDVFGFSIDATGTQDESGNVIRITAAKELTAVSTPAAGGRVRRLVASSGGEAVSTTAKATHDEPGISEEVRGTTEEPENTVKTNLIEKLKGVRLTEATKLEEDTRFKMLFRAVRDELSELDYGPKSDMPTAEKVQFVSALAQDLVTALGSGGMQESFKEQRLKENAATLAGELKLWADKLSTASDEEVPSMLEAIKQAIDKAADMVSGAEAEADDTNAESQEASVKKSDKQGGANATQDDFARMSAGMTEKLREALKSGDAAKIREAAVAVVGEEPQLDEKDKEIASLREKLKGQAIDSAMAKLGVELKLAEGAGPMVLKLIDRNALSFDDEFREVSGLKEAIKSVVKQFPGFVAQESASATAATASESEGAAAPAAEGDRQTEALTPQQAAQQALGSTGQAAAAAPAAPLGQSVPLRESAPSEVKPMTRDGAAQLRRLERRMLTGDTKAMKKHRDLRALYGV